MVHLLECVQDSINLTAFTEATLLMLGGQECYDAEFAGSQFGPDGPPPQPPSAWQHMLHAIGGVVNFFGRISFLVDENAHAFHFFISALLQLLDRYG